MKSLFRRKYTLEVLVVLLGSFVACALSISLVNLMTNIPEGSIAVAEPNSLTQPEDESVDESDSTGFQFATQIRSLSALYSMQQNALCNSGAAEENRSIYVRVLSRFYIPLDHCKSR